MGPKLIYQDTEFDPTLAVATHYFSRAYLQIYKKNRCAGKQR